MKIKIGDESTYPKGPEDIIYSEKIGMDSPWYEKYFMYYKKYAWFNGEGELITFNEYDEDKIFDTVEIEDIYSWKYVQDIPINPIADRLYDFCSFIDYGLYNLKWKLLKKIAGKKPPWET